MRLDGFLSRTLAFRCQISGVIYQWLLVSGGRASRFVSGPRMSVLYSAMLEQRIVRRAWYLVHCMYNLVLSHVLPTSLPLPDAGLVLIRLELKNKHSSPAIACSSLSRLVRGTVIFHVILSEICSFAALLPILP